MRKFVFAFFAGALALSLFAGKADAQCLVTYSWSGTFELREGFEDYWNLGPDPVPFTFSVSVPEDAIDLDVTHIRGVVPRPITGMTLTIDGREAEVVSHPSGLFFDDDVHGQADRITADTFSTLDGHAAHTTFFFWLSASSLQFTKLVETPPIIVGGKMKYAGVFYPNGSYWTRLFQGEPLKVTVTDCPPPAPNADPIVDAGPNQVVECTGFDGAVVALDGLAVDPDGDPLTFTWDVPAGVILDDPNIANPIGLFPIGITTATLTVTDDQGGVDVDDVVITVVADTSPPEAACTTDLVALWPPNHQMVEVNVFIDATDVCTAPENLILLAVEVSSNEPDDGLGDGDTAGDVFGEDGFTAPVDVTTVFTFNPETASFEGTILLRAERDGSDDGRAYTIEAFVVDNSLNIASTSCVIVVPHDRRK